MEKDDDVKDFLKENQDPFTSVAVLGAIVALITTLPASWITYSLSFCLTAALALVWSGIKFRRSKDDSLRLEFLKFFLMFGFWLFILYMLLTYRVFSWLFLFLPIGLFIIYVMATGLRKFQTMRNLFESRKIVKRFISLVICLVIVAISLLLAWPISTVLNVHLDELDHYKSIIQPY